MVLLQTLIMCSNLQSSLLEEVIREGLRLTSPDATVLNIEWSISPPEKYSEFKVISSSLLGNVVSILVKFTSDGFVPAYGRVNLEMALFRNIYVARRTIKSGERLSEKDISLMKWNVLGLAGNFTDDAQEIVGKIARKLFRENEPLDCYYLFKEPDVKVGQVLRAFIEIGGVTVTTLVRAMKDSYVGDVIAVRNIQTGFIFHGTLDDNLVVRVSGS